mmetsp:Transcript_61044/g.181885  ORF Transcript_61044/g.181885 Transcript_61044/m.181885 type:complete len:256 (+) Transcript_61044:142-909(+)
MTNHCLLRSPLLPLRNSPTSARRRLATQRGRCPCSAWGTASFWMPSRSASAPLPLVGRALDSAPLVPWVEALSGSMLSVPSLWQGWEAGGPAAAWCSSSRRSSRAASSGPWCLALQTLLPLGSVTRSPTASSPPSLTGLVWPTLAFRTHAWRSPRLHARPRRTAPGQRPREQRCVARWPGAWGRARQSGAWSTRQPASSGGTKWSSCRELRTRPCRGGRRHLSARARRTARARFCVTSTATCCGTTMRRGPHCSQ